MKDEKELTPKTGISPKTVGAGSIGPNAPLDSQGYPQAPQTPVIGAPGPGTPPGNVPWTPPTTPTVPPILSSLPTLS